MHYESTILVLLAATFATAVPLNINLGAYSPALVVGDGEISFGSGVEAEALVNTLSGASAGTEAATTIEGLKKAGEDTPTIVTPAEASASASSIPSSLFGIGRSVNSIRPRKDIADSGTEKRDLAGFNAALNYATGALKMSPGVELGTGEGGSGVGITVKPGGAIAKREDGELPTVTLLKIRAIGDQRATAKLRRAEDVEERDIGVASIDEVNLNLDGAAEMTITEVRP